MEDYLRFMGVHEDAIYAQVFFIVSCGVRTNVVLCCLCFFVFLCVCDTELHSKPNCRQLPDSVRALCTRIWASAASLMVLPNSNYTTQLRQLVLLPPRWLVATDVCCCVHTSEGLCVA